ncbi:MAG: response regulator transcription factor [Gaiellaceae bacterium]
MSGPIRIVIADDHAPTRAGIRVVLEADGFEVCGEAASADAAVNLALEERPAVCLLDINMPGGGISAAGAISERLPETAIVMLTVSRDDADLFDALRAGAAGYLLKDIDRRQLPDDLRGVLAGEAPLPRALVTRLIEEFRERGRRRSVLLAERPGVRLRQREWEILELLGEGLSTAEIAARLFIAEVTVRTHVSSILRKLRVPTREAAVELLRGR